MFERVILHVTSGPMMGQDLILKNGADCTLGRSTDCSLCIADPFALVSRRHCRIKVSAPLVRIQDLGSLNGTYVNGEKIGQRGREEPFEKALTREHTEYPLWQGDKLQLGNAVFQVELDPPPSCAEAETRNQEELWSSECLSAC
ncbi:MAG TPA: FHA domain-containing protein [Gemmataceae bacterium]|jgi:pSer/pThr/pTyr-binding forkhead associated (FHA) protein